MNPRLFLQSTATAILLLASTALADKPEKEIVGKWADAEGVESIEYKADGTFSETMAGGDVVKGKYSFPDAGHIKVEFEGAMAAAGAVVSPVVIKGDSMDVTVEGAPAMHYKRQK